MADIIDLTLLTDARRYLLKLLDVRGISYFLQKDGPRLFQIDPSKVELIVRTATRSRSSALPALSPEAVDYCRQEIRRDLIRRVVQAMLQTGL